ncbi:cupin [Spongiibacter sp. KMU-166]|uniref:Acireductone dioxygenase n=1 Tax=Spongiibacter thalassae TaxID=2721624 RepID=A0ABX1GAJ3_9GAMM|nr:cupin [Spongiibacter thalassae]NKI16189.1 cupin [Spongiibacter thalassae]
MTQLQIFADTSPAAALKTSTDAHEIGALMAEVGVRFEQWPTRDDVKAGDSQEAVLAAYRPQVEALVAEQGYQTVDVISLRSDNPAKNELRQKFLSEHHHTEDEVRFFVNGQGLFALHIGDKVYEICCEQGDLLSVPANTLHWFDLGPNPELVAIRFFNNPDGWVAHYSGSDIADGFSRLENT